MEDGAGDQRCLMAAPMALVDAAAELAVGRVVTGGTNEASG